MTTQITSYSQYKRVYRQSIKDPEGFWAEQAASFKWRKKWKQTLQWDFATPDVKWFVGGKLNITENCLDRHLKERGDQVALIWEPNDPSEAYKTYTYKELHAEVCRFANCLKANGIEKGDRICFYMPMVPELAIGVLACARLGAIHSVVFAGFSANALADRIKD
ncbi:MAG: acetyl-coenzyme A synthetase N-terminal domain-containing protein, partial [Bacteroidota bacterium]